MRCPSCEKFVSYDTEVEPEEQSEPEINGEQLTATYRRVLTCGECGEELKDAEIEFDETLTIDEPEGAKYPDHEDWAKCPVTGEEHEWSIDVSASATMDVEKTDRRGRPIKNSRYAKTFYGVELSGTATCSQCGATATIQTQNHEAASGFNELT